MPLFHNGCKINWKHPSETVEVEAVNLMDPNIQRDLIESYVPDSEEERKLVRKIDLYLLPTIWLMYLLSYVDRSSIGNAKVAGLQDDLNLTSDQYSTTLVVFFVGYVIFEIPSNMVLTRTRPSKFLPTIMFLWGVVTIAMGLIPNYQTLVGVRVLVGILEAGFAPGVLLLLSSWYKRQEQSKRFAVYISAAILSGAFGGLLGGGITSGLDGVHGIAGWRWLFIVEGAATAGWSIIASFTLLDFPATTKRFSEAERRLAIQRILADQVQSVPENGLTPTHIQALKMALSNWRVWLFVIGYMAIVGSSTLSYFYPTLVKGLGYSSKEAQYFTIPIYAAAFVVNGFTGYFMDKKPEWRGWVLGVWMTVAMVASIVTTVVYDFHARYGLLVVIASGLWASNGLSLSYASSTFGNMPNEVRAISLAFVNATGNLAPIYGSYLFPSEDAPKYILGFGVISGLCFSGIASYIALQLLLKWWP
ncbi:major facilitator superfamily domain-containing protein [Xylariaceae sp. FL1019]|nr:major facilitator superfamily domain-containing protein [Xylariaceae sp. FL1019]